MSDTPEGMRSGRATPRALHAAQHDASARVSGEPARARLEVAADAGAEGVGGHGSGSARGGARAQLEATGAALVVSPSHPLPHG